MQCFLICCIFFLPFIYAYNPDRKPLITHKNLLTPFSFIFTTWIVIYIAQGIFVLFQLGPAYRNLPIIQEGIKYWYILVCISQIVWTVSFLFEFITLSLIFIFVILASLIGCTRSLSYNTPPGQGLIPYQSNASIRSSASSAYTVMGRAGEYIIFRFPFYLHAGWIIVVSLLNVNIYLVYRNIDAQGQLWGAIMSLSMLLGVAVGIIFHRTAPDYLVACVLAYSTGGIAFEISNPTDYIMTTFEQHTIENVWMICVGITFLIVVLIILRFIIANIQRLRGRGRGDEYDEEEGSYINFEGLKRGFA